MPWENPLGFFQGERFFVKDLIGFAALVLIVFMMVYLIQQFIPGA